MIASWRSTGLSPSLCLVTCSVELPTRSIRVQCPQYWGQVAHTVLPLPLCVPPLFFAHVMPAGKAAPVGLDQLGPNVVIRLVKADGRRDSFPGHSHLYSSSAQ